MDTTPITDRDRAMAQNVSSAPSARAPPRTSAGVSYWFVKSSKRILPVLQAYEKVHGRKAHEPDPA